MVAVARGRAGWFTRWLLSPRRRAGAVALVGALLLVYLLLQRASVAPHPTKPAHPHEVPSKPAVAARSPPRPPVAAPPPGHARLPADDAVDADVPSAER